MPRRPPQTKITLIGNLKFHFAYLVLCCAVIVGCNFQDVSSPRSSSERDNDTSIAARQALLIEKERLSSLTPATVPGELVSTITFDVKGEHTKDFQDGVQHWISLESPERDFVALANAEEVVISDTLCSVIVDYPLDTKVTYVLVSPTGFTRKLLAQRISQLYHRIYEEEEATAIIKTIPVKKRQGIYNRNSTDGVYKIWGHDLGDAHCHPTLKKVSVRPFSIQLELYQQRK